MDHHLILLATSRGLHLLGTCQYHVSSKGGDLIVTLIGQRELYRALEPTRVLTVTLKPGSCLRVRPYDGPETHVLCFPIDDTRHLQAQPRHQLEDAGEVGFRLPVASQTLELAQVDGSSFFVSQGSRISEYMSDGTWVREICAPFEIQRFVFDCSTLAAISRTGYRVWTFNLASEIERLADWTPTRATESKALVEGGSFTALSIGSDIVLGTDTGYVMQTPLNLAGLVFEIHDRLQTPLGVICRLNEFDFLIGSEIRYFDSDEHLILSQDTGLAIPGSPFAPTQARPVMHQGRRLVGVCCEQESTLKFSSIVGEEDKKYPLNVYVPVPGVVDFQVTAMGHLFALMDGGLQVRNLGLLEAILSENKLCL